MTQEWGSQANDIQSNIIPHINHENLKNLLVELSQNEYFSGYYIKYKIHEPFVNTIGQRLQMFTLTLSYSLTECWNFIEISFNKYMDTNRFDFDVSHNLHPGTQQEQKYQRFSVFQGVKEFVLQLFDVNQRQYRGVTIEAAAARVDREEAAAEITTATTSALAWNAMDRLLDLLEK